MRTIIALTTFLALSFANAQIVNYEFYAESNASNTIKGNYWGVTAEGNVSLNQGAQTITVNIFNTANSGNISGFDFYDPNSQANTANTDWTLTSATTPGSNVASYLGYNRWNSTSEVTWLGDGTYTQYGSDKYTGAETNWNGDHWPMINARNPNEQMIFVFTYTGNGAYDMSDLENAWDTGNADLRLRFQNINNGRNSSAWHYDKFSTDLTRSVPEPSTYGIIGASALFLMILVRRFKK